MKILSINSKLNRKGDKMKKIKLSLLLILLFSLLDFTDVIAMENLMAENREVLNVNEESFLTQVEEIYRNAEKFQGQLVNIQGFIYSCKNNQGDFYYVVRKSPGCCGNDGLTGFEIIGDIDYPDDNQWVDVSGKITIDEDENGKYLYIKVDNIEEKNERGLEFVSK